MHAVTWLTITGAFVLGTVLALLGSLKLELARRLEIGETRIGGLVSALSFALIPMMLLSGLLIDNWGVPGVLVLGCLFTAGSLAGLALRRGYSWALLMLFTLGLGAACLSVSSIVLMPRAFFGDEHVGASLNLGNVFFALGALVTPTLVELLLRRFGFERTLGLLALLCLLPAALAVFVPRAEWTLGGQGDVSNVLHSWPVWAAGVVFALYSPVEFYLGTWSTTYLCDLGYSERRAAWWLSGFWFTFLAGRLVMAWAEYSNVVLPELQAWLILFLALAIAVVLGDLAGTPSRKRAARGLLVLGFLLGPIFPTLVAIVFRQYSDSRGTAYGVMFAIGSVGSLVLSPVIGRQVRRYKAQHAMRVPVVVALVLVAAALVLALTPG